MNNISKSIWSKKLPPLTGLALVVLSLTTIFWLSTNVILLGTKAAAGNDPKNVEISNISDTSFTISYATDDKVPGTLAYAKDPTLGAVALDDRDQQTGTPAAYRSHHITIKNLESATKYYVSIASGDEQFLNNGAPYQVTTAPRFSGQPTSQTPLAGKVTLDGGNMPTEGIIYLSSDTSQLVSALLKVDGSYLLPLNGILKKDLTGVDSFSDQTVLKMKILSSSLQSNVSLFANHTDSVPLVILSKDYDFTISNAPVDTSTASESATPTVVLTGFPSFEDTTIASSPSILVPEADFKFKNQQPTFKGKALPNAVVALTIHSPAEITTSVQADNLGNWEFKPAVPLDPGDHTIEIKSPDSTGAPQTIAKAFTVLAEGSEFTEPSILPTKRPTPTAIPITPTPTINLTPTIDPRSLFSPTPSASQITASPAPTNPPIPKSGSESTIAIAFFSMLSIAIGAILFFLTRGTTTHI